ncbi:putative demethylsterigmatocystin 6-O-methyltransferase [Microsporum canis]
MLSECGSASDLAGQIEEVTAQVQAGLIDVNSRKRLLAASQRLTVALESPLMTCRRVAFLPLEVSIIRCAIDTNLFNSLAKSSCPLSTASLVEATAVEHTLLERILKYLASMNYIEETGIGQWKSTTACESLANAGFAAGVKFNYDVTAPVFLKLPAWLTANNGAGSEKRLETPFQFSVGDPDASFFPWLSKNEASLANFHIWMNTRHAGETHWLDVYPLDKYIRLDEADNLVETLLVDVGGGNGHEARLVKERYPHLPGRIIFQDLSEIIQKCSSMHGVDGMIHDFFSPQPVRGARIYRLHHILHDWPDEPCRQILGHLRNAMVGHSILLIGDIVLPDTNAHSNSMQSDLTMMALFLARERSKSQWVSLLKGAGLCVIDIHTVQEASGESIITAVVDTTIFKEMEVGAVKCDSA